jgi:hypothetical protein
MNELSDALNKNIAKNDKPVDHAALREIEKTSSEIAALAALVNERLPWNLLRLEASVLKLELNLLLLELRIRGSIGHAESKTEAVNGFLAALQRPH